MHPQNLESHLPLVQSGKHTFCAQKIPGEKTSYKEEQRQYAQTSFQFEIGSDTFQNV